MTGPGSLSSEPKPVMNRQPDSHSRAQTLGLRPSRLAAACASLRSFPTYVCPEMDVAKWDCGRAPAQSVSSSEQLTYLDGAVICRLCLGLARPRKLSLICKGLRADFLLRIAANDKNGRHAAYFRFLCGTSDYLSTTLHSLKSARKHLTQSTGF